MKNFILSIAIIFPLFLFGQYSTYYGTYDVNSNVKADVNINATINKNVNVSGNINKTISTIDYGALASANAQREANRIAQMKVDNERDREAMIAIAKDPSKAFDYGTEYTVSGSKKDLKSYGFKSLTITGRKPHPALLTETGPSKYINISDDNITTELLLTAPVYLAKVDYEFKKEWGDVIVDIEKFIKNINGEVGSYNEEGKYFLHKADINRATVNGQKGYVKTTAREDDYELKITDLFLAENDGIMYYAYVTYTGDKDDITFEDLEGRRYYFDKLIKLLVSSTYSYNIKKL